MTFSEAILSAGVLVCLLLPLWINALFCLFLRRQARRHSAVDGDPGKVAVILPLRGADPSLERCLTGLLHQDYPAYRLYVVIDSADDPAWTVVREVLAREPHTDVNVEVRSAFDERCGLKVSAQRQVLERLSDDVEFVVFVDADADPAADWLHRMTAPLSDRAIGIASGIRWFDPVDGAYGSLVRYLNNAATMANMVVFRIPWGGSLAIRREAIAKAGLIEHWSRCLCEDTSAYEPIRRAGLRVAFVSSAAQYNGESTDLAGAYRFIRRQFLCARLHHPNWLRILLVHLPGFAALMVCVIALAFRVVAGDWSGAAAVAAALGVYAIAALLALQFSESILRALNGRQPMPGLGWKLIAAIAPTIFISMIAMIAAQFARSIVWRGIRYDIGPRNAIRMREYRPYRGSASADRSVL